MPTGSSSKSKWSLRSILGRKGATGAKDKESGTSSSRKHNKCTCKKVEEAASKLSEDECVASIKERVLAKLKEPLPSEMRQAARLSLDSLSFSPRPSTLTGHGISQRRRAGDEDDAAAGLNSRQSKYSTSSTAHYTKSWNLDSDVQASATSSTSKLDASRGYWSSCSSPTSGNVIARLMGLADHASSNMYTDTSFTFLRPVVTGCSSARRQQQGNSPRSHVRRLDSKRDCAQDFLDEMEDHLKQCDKALERIEAVMQLKKKLLYLNKASSVDNLSRMDHRRRRDVYNYAGDDVRVQHKHVRRGSMEQLIMHASLRRDMKDQQQLVAQEKSKRYRHRRSVSDGETPVFRPAGHVTHDHATYDIEPLDHESSSFKKWHTAAGAGAASDSEDVKSSRQRQYHHLDVDVKETLQSSPPHTPTKLQCHLELGELEPVNPDNSEQPSPVSVLDLTHLTPQDESSGSEDNSEQDLRKDIDKTGAAQPTKSTTRKKRCVVRALWPASSSSSSSHASDASGGGGGGVDEAKAAHRRRRRRSTSGEVDDAEVVKRMERSWGGGWGAEMAEVGVELEKLIFRRLLEETMIHVASCCRTKSR